MYLFIYVYIYIERERERKRNNIIYFNLDVPLYRVPLEGKSVMTELPCGGDEVVCLYINISLYIKIDIHKHVEGKVS